MSFASNRATRNDAAMIAAIRNLCVCLGLAFCLCGPTFAHAAMREGDIIFQTSLSSQSQAIQEATGSRYSHMGVIVLRGGQPFVLEAIATVRYTPLAKWIARGKDSHYVVKRLRDADRTLTTDALTKFRRVATGFIGKPYDLTFEWSDARMYCSELVWKIYDRALNLHIGNLQKIRDFRLDGPTVRQKLKERYGDKIPLDEPVISPQAMFDSPLLVTVEQK